MVPFLWGPLVSDSLEVERFRVCGGVIEVEGCSRFLERQVGPTL